MKSITVKHIAFCLWMILVPFYSFGQDSELDWEIHLGGSKFDVVKASCTDKLGNLYLTGFFQDTIIINDKAYVATGNADIFTIKVDQHGNVSWVNIGGSNHYRKNLIFEMGTCIAVSKNYVYVCGTFAKSANFQTLSLRSNGGKDIFIAKYHSETGKLIWVKSIGGKNHDNVSDLCIDRSDNIILTGNISSNTKLGDSIISINSTVSFVSKYDDNGNFLWLRHIEGNGYQQGTSVATDHLDNIYWGLNFRNRINSENETILSKGEGDIYLEKLSTDGNYLWHKHISGEPVVRMSSLDLASGDEIAVMGFYTGRIQIENSSIESIGKNDMFLCKYDKKGKLNWVKSAGGCMDDLIKADYSNSNGEIYLAGKFQGSVYFEQDTIFANQTPDLFLAKYSADGNLAWVQNVANSLNKNITSIACDSFSNIYLTGTFRNQIKLDNKMVSSAGENDIFIAKISGNGTNKNALTYIGLGNFGSIEKPYKIFPNPTTGGLNIIFSSQPADEIEINITSVVETITTLNFYTNQKRIVIDLSPYSKGIYLLTVKTLEQVFTEKIILQ